MEVPPFPAARDQGLEVRQQLLGNQVLMAKESEDLRSQLQEQRA